MELCRECDKKQELNLTPQKVDVLNSWNLSTSVPWLQKTIFSRHYIFILFPCLFLYIYFLKVFFSFPGFLQLFQRNWYLSNRFFFNYWYSVLSKLLGANRPNQSFIFIKVKIVNFISNECVSTILDVRVILWMRETLQCRMLGFVCDEPNARRISEVEPECLVQSFSNVWRGKIPRNHLENYRQLFVKQCICI